MKNTFIDEYETKKLLAEFIIKSDKLSMGVLCAEFEHSFAKYQNRKESILFNSGGSANLALLQSLKNLGRIKQNDKIGFSALTWSTNVMPIIQLNMIPVAVDCNKDYLNIMSENLIELIKTNDIKMMFLTNVLGFTGDLDQIKKICDKNNIILIEDNCESLGTELPTGKAGNFGLASSFSFFVAHHMSTIEGGMVCTDDDELAEMLRIVRANGWDRNLNASQQVKWRKRFNVQSEFNAKYTFYELGYNFRPTEITGFLGINQLKHLDKNIKSREKNHIILEEIAKNNSDLIIIRREHLKNLSPFAFPIICTTPENRQKYMSRFSGAGIEIRPMIAGNIQKQPFFNKYVKDKKILPGADYVHNCGFYCGNYPELTEYDIDTISSCLFKY